ncbi:MAG TPA: MBL fold metallo-hydrolase [Solirubrobacterales bacterium]|jgi:glyoxylase-like metal-dependent hydrolase (beta-lactamase superfamily II)|nr:MBL fold metallo-hydrolase [Solirubrobacterales bacterium]
MTLAGTNTYVVGRDPAFVIDPGPDDREHIAAVAAEADRRGGLAGILLTHSHGDHAAGAEGLDAPVIWGEGGGSDPGPFAVVETPGHARDHVCFLLDGACFTGDLILGEGSSIVPPDGGSLVAYLDSLRIVQGLDLELLCPGHGPFVTDPQAKIAEYLEHRLERERKLVAALDAGERSRARLLDAAWDDVPAGLRDAAGLAMQAHLEKLEAEGRLPPDLRD